ncbi:sulfite exporter TauE/SafE family protein [Sinomicrobium weinanense]|uniref:Sulfite exporter TauE/SafE family protein n=1 Tax=Sinomicrobium weinanense TaxID=2842200 RepID=A0A926Q4T8_9FLAO|nr:sulfite exporter TauE/SafE family protein [Sinomicrobium weinanense]MBC9798339.1 sulfite exporter TauE/SafE family protein [Sinomicrobium weinanense]MBU3121790.1 sulfite exporter TauE/SafE family protein [Sinomicrobium weinanense]
MLLSAILLGMAGGFHCVGMCGPIAFMLPLDRGNPKNKLWQLGSYHLGRIVSYTAIGLLFGMLGLGFRLFGIQQQLSIGIGVVMIVLVWLPRIKLSPGFLVKWYYRAVSGVKNRLGAALRKQAPGTFFLSGILNGLLPCGLVYMAVLAAMTTAGIWEGGLYMALFGLGTVPLMTAVVYLGNVLKQKTRQKVQRLIPVFVVFMGCLFILRGLGLGIPYISPAPVVGEVSYKVKCH